MVASVAALFWPATQRCLSWLSVTGCILMKLVPKSLSLAPPFLFFYPMSSKSFLSQSASEGSESDGVSLRNGEWFGLASGKKLFVASARQNRLSLKRRRDFDRG